MYLREPSFGAPSHCLLHLALHNFIFSIEQTINIIENFTFSPPD